jgi:hypothetical protein
MSSANLGEIAGLSSCFRAKQNPSNAEKKLGINLFWEYFCSKIGCKCSKVYVEYVCKNKTTPASI